MDKFDWLGGCLIGVVGLMVALALFTVMVQTIAEILILLR